MMVDTVVEALKVEKMAAHPVAEKTRFQQRSWLPSKRRKTAASPATVSQDQEARVQAASAVVNLSLSWADAGFGLGYEVPAFMADHRRVAQAKNLGAAFEVKLLHGVVKFWQQLLEWFEHQGVKMPSSGWPSVFVEDFLQHTAEKSGGPTRLLTFCKLKLLV